MKKFIFSVLLILLVSTNVYCETSKTTTTLMNTPMSMLEWGMYKTTLDYSGDSIGKELIKVNIQKEIEKFPERYKNFICDGVCYFDFRKNRIVIHIDLFLQSDLPILVDFEKEFLKKLCVITTEIIKKRKNEENFFYNGYATTNYPTGEDINNHIMIKVVVYDSNNMMKKILSSQSDKNSKEIFFNE